MARKVSVGTLRFLARPLAVAGFLSMGAAPSFASDLGMVSEGAFLGDSASSRLRDDSRNPEPRPASMAWKVSVGVFAALQAADAATSYGYPEANPIYGQRFGARGVAIKALIAVAVPLIERRIVRRYPRLERVFTGANLGVSGATARAVIYNARDIASQPAAPAPITITPGVGTVTHP